MEDSMDFSQKLKIELPYDLAISLLDLGYLSKENENINSEKKLKTKKNPWSLQHYLQQPRYENNLHVYHCMNT